MKRLVVLGPSGQKENWLTGLLQGLSPQPRFAHAESLNTDCDGLLVVDDGSTDGFAAIRSALALRDIRPDIPIAVVTTLDGKWSEGECLVRSQHKPGDGKSTSFSTTEKALRQLMTGFVPCIDVRVDEDAILFEYNG